MAICISSYLAVINVITFILSVCVQSCALFMQLKSYFCTLICNYLKQENLVL